MAAEDPNVIVEKPSASLLSSVSLRCRSPVALVPKPIVLVAVFGAIVNVELPEIVAPISIEFVVIVSALAPMLKVPLAPVVTVLAVIEVAPKTLLPPTAPLIATVAVPALIPTVRADVLS